MPTEAALTRMLRSLGAERQRLDREIQRLQKIVDQEAGVAPNRFQEDDLLTQRFKTRRSSTAGKDDVRSG